jgi:release factor glutamine methyltransferase
MTSSSKEVFFADHIFHVWENVYEPAEDSFLFAENLAVNDGDVVLDMGTGCGILGIVAAEKAAYVIAVDVNPFAVRCAKENARFNHVAGKLFFVQGDLFAPIRMGQEFDLILFNAPYLPAKDVGDDSWLRLAWAGGITGREVIDRFICEVSNHLKQAGRIFLMQSTLSDIDQTLRRFGENGLKTRALAQRALPFFETIVLIGAW